MKFGVREIANVVFKAKSNVQIGDKVRIVIDDTEYILYLPDTPVLELPDEVITWLPEITGDKDIIDCYILYSVSEEMAFVK